MKKMYVSAADTFPFRATGKHAGPGLVKASVVVSIHLLHADSDELCSLLLHCMEMPYKQVSSFIVYLCFKPCQGQVMETEYTVKVENFRVWWHSLSLSLLQMLIEPL